MKSKINVARTLGLLLFICILVTVSKYRGMWHVFQQTADFVPEAKKAWKEVGNFLRAL